MKREEILNYLNDRCRPPLWDGSFQQTLCREILRRDEPFILKALKIVEYRLERADSNRGYDARWSILLEDIGEELASSYAGTEAGERLLFHVCDMSLRKLRMLPFAYGKEQKYLGYLGQRAFGLLVALLERFPVNVFILEALVATSDPRVGAILVDQLARPCDNVYAKCRLIELIAQSSDIPDRLAALTPCVAHPEGDVREQAIATLSALDSKRAAPFVRQLLSDRLPQVRIRAIQLIAETGDIEATISVASCLTLDQPSEVRIYAARTLGVLKPSVPPAELTAGLSDSDNEVRGMSAWALGEIGDPRSLNALLQCRNDPCKLTAWSIETAIAQLRSKSDVNSGP